MKFLSVPWAPTLLGPLSLRRPHKHLDTVYQHSSFPNVVKDKVEKLGSSQINSKYTQK